MFSLIGSIIIGFFAGLIARALHPGDDKMSWLWTIGLGIAGSLFATFIGKLLGLYKNGQSAGFIMSVVGAVAVLAIYNWWQRKQLKG